MSPLPTKNAKIAPIRSTIGAIFAFVSYQRSDRAAGRMKVGGSQTVKRNFGQAARPLSNGDRRRAGYRQSQQTVRSSRRPARQGCKCADAGSENCLRFLSYLGNFCSCRSCQRSARRHFSANPSRGRHPVRSLFKHAMPSPSRKAPSRSRLPDALQPRAIFPTVLPNKSAPTPSSQGAFRASGAPK